MGVHVEKSGGGRAAGVQEAALQELVGAVAGV